VNWINFHCGDNEASCFTATRNVMNKWTVFLCIQKLRWLQIAYRVGFNGNLCTWGIFHVVDFGVDSKGRSAQKGHTP
jgi:hypothetical protein